MPRSPCWVAYNVAAARLETLGFGVGLLQLIPRSLWRNHELLRDVAAGVAGRGARAPQPRAGSVQRARRLGRARGDPLASKPHPPPRLSCRLWPQPAGQGLFGIERISVRGWLSQRVIDVRRCARTTGTASSLIHFSSACGGSIRRPLQYRTACARIDSTGRIIPGLAGKTDDRSGLRRSICACKHRQMHATSSRSITQHSMLISTTGRTW